MRGRCVSSSRPTDAGADVASRCVDRDGDGYPGAPGCGRAVDCADDRAETHPGANEICDGADNDCDGEVDETFGELGGVCTVGTGPCTAHGTYVCATDGEGVSCDAEPAEGSEEVCDGVDNDCDGVVDNLEGSSAVDTNTSVKNCGTCNNDCRGMFPNARAACRRGGCVLEECDEHARNLDGASSNGCEYRCEASRRGVVASDDAICDGLDNDCDGRIDEDVTGTLQGEKKSVGDECTVGVGQCAARGSVVCLKADASGGDAGGMGGFDAGSVDGAATGARFVCDATAGTPSPEICDDLDNDCDGRVDNSCDDDGDGYCDDGVRSIGSPTICSKGAGDCDDENARVHPGMEELCSDEVDNDCDGTINEGCGCAFDGTSVGVCADGRRDASGTCRRPADYQNPESGQCDGTDNDCDGVIDEGCPCTFDSDGDGDTDDEAGLCTDATRDARGTCEKPAAYTTDETRCDSVDNDCDGDVDEGCVCRYKGTTVGVCGRSGTKSDGTCKRPPNYESTESTCDGFDNDCDGVVDEGCSCDYRGRATGVCAGAGTVDVATGNCRPPGDYVDPETAPGQCDRKDNDCDGVVDEQCPCVYDPTEHDGDHRDSDGSADQGVCRGQTVDPGSGSCTRPADYESEERTCDDLDNDCDGSVDEGCDDDGDDHCDAYRNVVGSPSVCPNSPAGIADDCADGTPGTAASTLDWMEHTHAGAAPRDSAKGCLRDVDGDGWGDSAPPSRDATAGIGSIQSGGDCDDRDPSVHPGATEVPGDQFDSNCDGKELCFADADDDGYRTSTTITSTDNLSCRDAGEATPSDPVGDCVDFDPKINPGAAPKESSSGCYEDRDGDDYGDASVPGAVDPGTDCNDADASIHPSAAEVCNRIDDDCDGSVDEQCSCTYDPTETKGRDTDASHDYGVCRNQTVVGGGSCETPARFEKRPERTCDGVDNDCDGNIDEGCDDDGDGYCDSARTVTSGAACSPGDCDDTDPDIHPTHSETPGDEVDSNCDGKEVCFADADDDGFRTASTVQSVGDTDCDEPGEATRSDPKGDCDDSDPAIHPKASEKCDSSTDHDCDGAPQCGDPDCVGVQCARSGSTCGGQPSTNACNEDRCSDGIDNDRPYKGRSADGADCLDGSCSCPSGTKCVDSGRDDPKTGADIGVCIEAACKNGRDDDGDGAIDCADEDCDGNRCKDEGNGNSGRGNSGRGNSGRGGM